MSAKVEVLPGDPRGLDRLKIDAILIPLYERCAQPLGAAGSIDWRLCGRLGRMLKTGVFRGAEEELVLTTSLGRFGAERLFLWGLGRPAPRNADEAKRIAHTLISAGAKETAIAPPELADPKAPAPVEALAAWLPHFAKLDRIVILDSGAIDVAKLKEASPGLGWS